MGVLIVGSGVVGSQIAALEIERGETPVVLESAVQPEAIAKIVDLSQLRLIPGDVLKPLDLSRVIHEEGITRIIHTAANPLLTEGALRNPFGAIELNVMGLVNVLEATRIFGIERVVMCSTSAIYGRRGGQDDGADGREEAYPRPGSIYAATKQAGEDLGLNYHWSFGLDFVAVRFAAVFGPWTGRGGGGGPTQRYREMVERSIRGEPAEVADSGSSMEVVYSKDAAKAAVLACHADRLETRVFNVGMGRSYTAQEVADTLVRVVPKAQVKVVPTTAVAAQSSYPAPKQTTYMDLTRSASDLGYAPDFDLEAGLRDYVATYEHRDAETASG